MDHMIHIQNSKLTESYFKCHSTFMPFTPCSKPKESFSILGGSLQTSASALRKKQFLLVTSFLSVAMAKPDMSRVPEPEGDKAVLDIFGALPCSQRPGAWMGAAYAYFNRLESEAKKASKEPEVVVVESPSPAKSKAAATRSRSRSRTKTTTALLKKQKNN